MLPFFVCLVCVLGKIEKTEARGFCKTGGGGGSIQKKEGLGKNTQQLTKKF